MFTRTERHFPFNRLQMKEEVLNSTVFFIFFLPQNFWMGDFDDSFFYSCCFPCGQIHNLVHFWQSFMRKLYNCRRFILLVFLNKLNYGYVPTYLYLANFEVEAFMHISVLSLVLLILNEYCHFTTYIYRIF